MALLTQPLRDEHKELYMHVETLRLAGDAINESLTSGAHDKIEEAYTFLTCKLYPHSQAEEIALYPMVQKVMGNEQVTDTMSRDHVEVARLTEELGTLRVHRSQLSITTIQAMALRRVLYGLYALIKLHFTKEEEIYLPLLDAKLSEHEAHTMITSMEAAYKQAKAAVPD